ncbi:MAG: response regulator [Chloroflexi bacterium]|nr:response regulator [Chloroflexota bacterium]
MTATTFSAHQGSMNVILIISQDTDMVRVWKLLFEQRNCRVICETNQHDGLSSARLISPTLTILDLDLPHEERVRLCRDLRASANGTLLLINSSYRSIDVLEYKQAGVDETVPADVSPMGLLIKSLAWLARQDWIVPRKQSVQMYG